MFIMEGSEKVEISELSRALDESFANLRLLDVDCAVDCPTEGLLLCRDAARVYDFFEAVVEDSMENLQTYLFSILSSCTESRSRSLEMSPTSAYLKTTLGALPCG